MWQFKQSLFILALLTLLGCAPIGETRLDPTPPNAATAPRGPYAFPSKCLGFDLTRLEFDDTEFYMDYAPGTAFATKFTTGMGPGGVYGIRISMAHDVGAFTTLISEEPCNLNEAKALKLFGYQNISTSFYAIASDPALDLYRKAKAANLANSYAWLKPNTTYYIISINAEIDAFGLVVRMPSSNGYYYRQGHTNDPSSQRFVPRAILDLL